MASVQSTTGSRVVRISVSNAGYTMFRGSVKSTGYPLHSLVSPSLISQCVTVCHHISAGLYTYLVCPSILWSAMLLRTDIIHNNKRFHNATDCLHTAQHSKRLLFSARPLNDISKNFIGLLLAWS